MSRVRNGNFQGACTRFFEFTHKLKESSQDTISHPNQYFELSRATILQQSTAASVPLRAIKEESSGSVHSARELLQRLYFVLYLVPVIATTSPSMDMTVEDDQFLLAACVLSLDDSQHERDVTNLMDTDLHPDI